MLDKYIQQWSALQTARAANLPTSNVFMAYFALTGTTDEVHVAGYLTGLLMLSRKDRDLIAHAINESLDATGSTVDGAHYSDEDAAGNSGYEEYLRALTLSPDGYDFTAPPAGDHTTSNAIPTVSIGTLRVGVSRSLSCAQQVKATNNPNGTLIRKIQLQW